MQLLVERITFFILSRVIEKSMAQTFCFCFTFLGLAHFTISSWAILPLLEEKLHLPIVAWYAKHCNKSNFKSNSITHRYPFSTDNRLAFALTYVYQIFGISMSACFNVSTDTFGSAMISQANAQVRRLGIQLSKAQKISISKA